MVQGSRLRPRVSGTLRRSPSRVRGSPGEGPASVFGGVGGETDDTCVH